MNERHVCGPVRAASPLGRLPTRLPAVAPTRQPVSPLSRLQTLLLGLCIALSALPVSGGTVAAEASRSDRIATVPVPADPVAALGRQLFFDTRLSEPAGLACAGCHDPARAFSGDNGSGLGVALGSRPDQVGFRKAPTIMYLATAPVFSIGQEGRRRVPRGGLFWDGRVDTLEQQAAEPFFNPREMNLAGPEDLARRVADAPYAEQFRAVFGADVLDDPERALAAVTRAIGAFERSSVLQPFSSKFDAVLRGQAEFTAAEDRGYKWFTIAQKGNCHECHALNVDSKDPRDALFTDFRYHALGVPRNARLPHTVQAAYHDLGLCEPLRLRPGVEDPDAFCGWFKVPTLRNVALTAPYMHNGRVETLREAVAFYATRDTDPALWFPGGERFDDLPQAMRGNVDVKTRPYHRKPGRRPALDDAEIDDIVAFLNTLTDGFVPPAQAVRPAN